MFHAVYESTGSTPFATVAQEDLMFPPSVLYKNKSFHRTNMFSVDTIHQQENFKAYCKRNNIETDVNLSNL